MRHRHTNGSFFTHPRLFIIVAVIAGLATASFSLWIGLQQSTWFDEAYSILLAKQPIGQLLHLAAVDVHPPLYYLLLKLWAAFFGWSPLALRLLSVTAMGGVVIVAGLLARRLFGIRAGIATLLVVATLPLVVRYGFEIRMYALATLIGMAATYVLVCAVGATRHKRAYYVLYAILVALGMYTLYYLALVWLAHLVWLVWRSRRAGTSIVKSWWLRAYVLSVLIFLPWLPWFFGQLGNNALSPVAQSLSPQVVFGMVSYSFLYLAPWQLNSILTLVVLILVVIIIWLILQSRRQTEGETKRYYTLMTAYVVVPLTIMIAVIALRPMYIERYLTDFIVGVALIIGIGVAIMSRRKPVMAGLVLAVVLAATVSGAMRVKEVGNYNFQRVQRPDSRQMVQTIGCHDVTYIAADAYAFIDASYELQGCTVLFYDQKDLAFVGGFAPLHGDPRRITSTDGITSKRIVLFGFDTESSPKRNLTVGKHYRLVDQRVFGGSQTRTYQRF